MTTAAAIFNDPEWNVATYSERRRWTTVLSIGPTRRKHTRTRREAIEFCQEQGIPFSVVEVGVEEAALREFDRAARARLAARSAS